MSTGKKEGRSKGGAVRVVYTAAMICPRCGAEYRAGFAKCADCDVDLVEAPPGQSTALEAFLRDEERPRGKPGWEAADDDGVYQGEPVGEPEAPELGDPNRDPFCSFWKGSDARICAELCSVLDEAGIPHKTIHRQDHLFNFANQVPYEVGVPASLYEKAELAIKEAFGADQETGEGTVPLLPAPDRDPADFEKGLRDAIQDANEWLGPRYPEDATVEVWSGEETDAREMIEMSLREHDVMTRSEEEAGRVKVFVLPEHEEKAREIVREVMQGEPPE
jgi:hypothetical protein